MANWFFFHCFVDFAVELQRNWWFWTGKYHHCSSLPKVSHCNIHIFTVAGVKDNILILILDCMTPLLHCCWCQICGNQGLINTIKLNMPVFTLWCWNLHYYTPSHPTTRKPHPNCLVLTVPVQYYPLKACPGTVWGVPVDLTKLC